MTKLKIAGYALLVAVIAWSGWQARGWFEDSKDLAAKEAMEKTLDAAMDRESKVAREVQDKLAQLKPTERIIDRGIIREVQKPIYKRVCFEPELVRLLNAAADGETAALPGKLTDEVPADATPSD
ncbi:hypothetical protein [Marinobacter sp. NFXS9]|uniref:hypothetical protein n=1 Tax=Marinobacter sp. NFXS9 TaxID=2818433 RepID=UPI0032E005DB